MDKFLIVNADDFGASAGVNRGILECHTRGVVTSTSLMVTGRAVREAVAISRDQPEQAIETARPVCAALKDGSFRKLLDDRRLCPL